MGALLPAAVTKYCCCCQAAEKSWSAQCTAVPTPLTPVTHTQAFFYRIAEVSWPREPCCGGAVSQLFLAPYTPPAYAEPLPRNTLTTGSFRVIATVDFLRDSGAVAWELTPLARSARRRRLRRR